MRILFILLLALSFLQAKELEKVSLQFHWLDQFEFAGYYIAKEKGFYEDAGLDVKFKKYEYGLNMLEEVKSNRTDFAIGGSDLLIGASEGEKIKLLASIFQSSPLVLLTTPNTNIKSIKDFKNKKAMLTPDAISSVTFNAMMKKENISMDDIVKQKHSFNVQDLIKGKTDLLQSYISNEPYYLEKAGIKPIIFNPKDYGFDFYSDILFTSKEYYEKNSQKVLAFRKASLKGWRYAFDNIVESVNIIYKKYNQQNKSKEALLYEAQKSKELALLKVIPLGNIDIVKLQRMYDVFNLMNLVNNKLNFDDIMIKNEIFYQINLTKKELLYLKEHPVLKVSNESDYPPYDFLMTDNTPAGYSIDLMKLLATKLNIKFEFVNGYDWTNLIKLFCDKKIDILHPTDKSKQVVQCASFTRSIINDTSQFITRKDFENIKSIEELYGYTIATPKGWEQTETFKKHYSDKFKIIETIDTQDAMKKVVSGEADFAIDYKNVFNYYILKNAITNLKIQEQWFDNHSNNNLYIASHKNNPILRDILQKALDSINPNELEQIQKKWFGQKKSKIVYTPKEKEFLLKIKEIKVCIDPNWLPFEALDKNKKHIGFSSKFFELFKNDLSIPIEVIKTNNWSQSLQYAKEKRCDILSLVMETPNRKEYFNFTKPYVKASIVLVTKDDIPFLANLDELNEKHKIAIPKDYGVIEYLSKKYPKMNIVEVENIEDGLSKVKNGVVFGYIGFLPSIAYQFQNRFLSGLKISAKLDETWSLGMAVRDDEPQLLSIFNKLISNIDPQKSKQILENSFAIKYEKGIDYDLIWQIIIASILILLFILYRNRTLKNYNKLLNQKVKEEVQKNIDNERLIMEQSKLASMGEMIGNIAHQWRQPLAVTNLAVSVIKERSQLGILEKEHHEKKLDDIEKNLQYMSQTIEDFLNYFSPNKKKEYFNIDENIKKVLNLLSVSLENKHIKLQYEVNSDLKVYGFEDEFVQVVMSVINNAIQVLEDKKEKKLEIKAFKKENSIFIEISDSGGGVLENIKDKIFEPYFTTKHQSNGTGLGLYMSKMIIEKSMNGKLSVQNTQFGAKFIIEFKEVKNGK